MRLSSSSLEMASARTSCSLKSAKRLTASPRWLGGPETVYKQLLNSLPVIALTVTVVRAIDGWVRAIHRFSEWALNRHFLESALLW